MRKVMFLANMHAARKCLFVLLAFFAGALVSSRTQAQGKIVGYYAAYKASVLPYNQVEYSNLTDIDVAFAFPNADGSIGFIDPRIPFPQLVNAAHAAGKRVLISLGGAANSTYFPSVTADSAVQAKFIDNIVAFIDTNDYDGVDIDWETPANAQQTAHLTAFVQSVRTAFDRIDSSRLITMAIPATSYGGQHFDYKSLTPYVDWYNVMCYDFVGSWVRYAGHNSPLYQAPNDPNQAGSDSSAVYYNISRGIPGNKLVLGVPFYGDVFNASGLYMTGTWTGNTVYSDVMNDINSGWTYKWDGVSEVPYLTNSASTQFITFEDTNSIKLKTEFSIRQGLGGIMIWELSQDLYNGRQPLLEAIAETMRGLTAIESAPTAVAGFKLLGNYPNPFNPTTAISYRLSPQAGSSTAVSHVSVKIYDVLGREVAELVDSRQDPGMHTVIFNAAGLTSGVYFYRVVASSIEPPGAGRCTATGKMVLMK